MSTKGMNNKEKGNEPKRPECWNVKTKKFKRKKGLKITHKFTII